MPNATDPPRVAKRTALAVAAVAALIGLLPGCGGGRDEPWEPITRAGVPVIRVLLTPQPVDQATISAVDYELIINGRTQLAARLLPPTPIARRAGRWRIGST